MSNSPVIRKRHRGQKGTHPLLVHFKGRGRTGTINECKKPDLGASKEDLAEFHREKVALAIARRRARIPNSCQPPNGSIAQGNRRGGEHQHRREIGRRQRQAPV